MYQEAVWPANSCVTLIRPAGQMRSSKALSERERFRNAGRTKAGGRIPQETPSVHLGSAPRPSRGEPHHSAAQTPHPLPARGTVVLGSS